MIICVGGAPDDVICKGCGEFETDCRCAQLREEE